jgi:prepilin-type N-terminal cleavage/methylation domain-containing protein
VKLSKITKGFTLIEILLVIAILSILLVVVFAALNPAQRLEDTRNSRRWNDVNQVLTAIHECIIDNDAATCGLTANDLTYQLGDSSAGNCDGSATLGSTLCTGAEAACLDLSTPLANYIASIPQDPSSGSDVTTGYSVTTASTGIVTVAACSAEGSEVIQVSR